MLRVWIDVTNSPHVVFFRPLVALLRSRGNEVSISARDFAQTLELLDDARLEHTVVGPPHAGASRISKIRAMGGRLVALRRFARPKRFDIALSHASHELPLAARSLGIRSAYAFDYEFALEQHGYTAARHQHEVGAGYFDKVVETITGGQASTLALTGSTEAEQFSSSH